MLALYRRYRPELFSEMIGQEHVTVPLSVALDNHRLGHAYLFSGPRGTGKTTSARVFARCLNCAEGPTSTPCGVCPSCVDLGRDGGGSLDVVEIDAASHNGVDDARELRERAVFAPARDRYKIFILDEAHMVTPQGFNALLKIVEEPPEHIKFIFATTEPEKVIGTIRSRTYAYAFRLVAPSLMESYIAQICAKEEIPAEEGVLPLVVRAGGGSVRDTLSILDQLIAGSQEGITYAMAADLLGYAPDQLIYDFFSALAAADGAAAYRVIERVIDTGNEPLHFLEDLMEWVRDMMVAVTAPESGARAIFGSYTAARVQQVLALAKLFDLTQLEALAQLLVDRIEKMVGPTSPRLLLEILLAGLLLAVRPTDVARSAASSPVTAAGLDSAEASSPSAPASVPPKSAAVKPAAEAGSETVAAASAAAVSEANPVAAPKKKVSLSRPTAPSLADLQASWPTVLQQLPPQTAAILTGSTPVRLIGDGLTIGMPAAAIESFRADEAGKNELKDALQRVTGISFRLSGKPIAGKPLATAPAENALAESEPVEVAEPESAENELAEVAESEPVDNEPPENGPAEAAKPEPDKPPAAKPDAKAAAPKRRGPKVIKHSDEESFGESVIMQSGAKFLREEED